MSQEAAFWDASALVPLCLKELTTDHAERLFRQYQQVVWWATVVEVRSAVARSARLGGIPDAVRAVLINRLTHLSVSWHVIPPASLLRDHAQTLLDKYPLRAADSLQLAASLFWCRREPYGRVFISGDTRLCAAAAAEGFQIITLQ